MLGAHAALQLGPGAFNLAGAKTLSVIIGQQVKGVLPELPGVVGCGGSGAGAAGVFRQHAKLFRAGRQV